MFDHYIINWETVPLPSPSPSPSPTPTPTTVKELSVLEDHVDNTFIGNKQNDTKIISERVLDMQKKGKNTFKIIGTSH